MNQEAAIRKTVNLYKNVGWKKWFSIWRFRMAPYVQVEKQIPKNAKAIELGCGEGIFSNFVAISSPRRKVIGYEINEERIKEASRGVKNVIFKKADITKLSLPNADVVILFHVLHHLTSYEDQEKLLRDIYKLLKKNKKLIIVEVNVGFTPKYLITWVFDHFIVPIVFEKKIYDKIYFREKSEWRKLIREIGFSVRQEEMDKGMIFPHLILSCRKSRNL